MQVDQFRSLLRTRPFKPFQIITASGEKYAVNHLEMVGMSPSGRTLSVMFEEGFAIIDMAVITACVILKERRKKGTA